LDLLWQKSWLISALGSGFAFGIRLRISSNLFCFCLSLHPSILIARIQLCGVAQLNNFRVADHPDITHRKLNEDG
jgi:hypothetical protein